MRDGIERLVQRFGLKNRVQICGYVPSIEGIWAENHVAVLASRREGTLPLALSEAMMCGRPVVTTDVAGQSEIVEDGVSGFIAEAPTLGAFGKVLDRVWERRMELEAMGKAASACIRRYIPPDPARIFAEKIKTLVSTDLC